MVCVSKQVGKKKKREGMKKRKRGRKEGRKALPLFLSARGEGAINIMAKQRTEEEAEEREEEEEEEE